MGYASVQCKTVPYAMGKVVLGCPYGSIATLVTNGVGATPSAGNDLKDACLVNDQNKACSGFMDLTRI